MFDILIIGAGICGTSIARELTRFKLKIALVDKENDVSNGTTKANSAIIHAGYDPKPGTLMAELNSRGNPMFDTLCSRLQVPFKRIGSLVLAFNDTDLKTLGKLYKQGIQNRISKMEIIDRDQLRNLEPEINPAAIGALYAQTAGIVGPWELAIALAENAIDNGAELYLNSPVVSINKVDKVFTVTTDSAQFRSKVVINCAGVQADKINNLIAPPEFKIMPRRGEYYVLDKTAGKMVRHVVFQPPGDLGKGVLVTPTVHGNVLIGPNSERVSRDDAIETTAQGLEYIQKTAQQSFTNIPLHQTINIFAGLRAEPDTGDFIIAESPTVKGFINIAGIKSPGLSAAPAIAEKVVGIVDSILPALKPNQDFIETRREIIHFAELSDKAKARLIKKDPRYARIICRCENITEGEIVDAIHRNAGATTVDSVKRRVRPGTGRCQGGFCMPRVIEILAREQNQEMDNILKDGLNSPVLTGMTKSEEIRESEPAFTAPQLKEVEC
ncbi:MAG TPA: FAD/NAD(P)-binding oxidoreductase [Candidatus Marinimicrobia bacterium]|nr:FAD/NAD(P)-binding oxidoreductase [Candidatus Neomarinimicrobiota bacterium]